MRVTSIKRSGSISILFLLMLIAVIAVGAMAVDLALIQAARTDMRITADLSARAATVEYIETESVSSAIARAQDVASHNSIAATSLQLESEDIIPGNSARNGNKFVFTANATPFNSFRVNARLDSDSVNGSMPLIFSGVHNQSSIDLSQSATATETYLDIVLVLDRSGSMGFDLSGVSWEYPDGESWYVNYFTPPLPGSRWVSLENAISVFLDEMNQKTKKEQVALVTYSSDYSIYSEYYNETFTSQEVQVDQAFTNNYDAVMGAVTNLGDGAVVGATAISSGIEEAITLLASSPQVVYSEKIIILLTDGQWNVGYDPVLAAEDAANEHIKIHTVSFGAGASQSTMQQIATVTGGKAYDAPGDTELAEAFLEIARSIGLSYTE